MADAKISALTALTGANAATDDLLVIVDTSATQTKSMTRAEMFLSTPPISIAAGTATTDVNALNITQTWNAAGVTFTGLELNVTNTASAAASLLADLQLGGTSQFSVSKAGAVLVPTAGYYQILNSRLSQGPFSGEMMIGNTSSKEYYFQSTVDLKLQSDMQFSWSNSTSDASTTVQAAIGSAGANSVIFNGGGTVTTTTRTEINKAVASIANNSATAVLTVTIPNAAHSASIRVRLTGSLGAGGAIGANESTQDAEYMVNVARTAGVNAVATIGAVVGQAAAASVAGAANAATTATLSAISGAVGATNTFTINVTIARSGGSSANHTCFAFAELLNANATGVTIA